MPFRRPRRLCRVFSSSAISVAALCLAACFAPKSALADSLPTFAPDVETLSRSLPMGSSVEALPGGFRVVVPPKGREDSATDPRFHFIFNRVVYVYAERSRDVPAKGLYRSVALHGDPDSLDRLIRCARLTARLLRLHREHFGRDTVFGRSEDAADVWFPRGPSPVPGAGSVGGETHGSEVYIWATISASRSPLEWTRTLVHEWGHLTLSAARGFKEPEGDAAGFLGERLYMKWLDEDARNPASRTIADDGTTPEDLALYCRRQVTPLIARWNQEETGPKSPLLGGTDAPAMDYYIGMALAADEAFGSSVLGRALVTIMDVRPGDLVQSLARVIGDTPILTVRLPAWIPMQKGNYTLATADSRTEGAISFAREAQPVALASNRAPVHQKILLTGWKYVVPVRGTISRILLKRIADPEAQP